MQIKCYKIWHKTVTQVTCGPPLGAGEGAVPNLKNRKKVV